MSAPGTPPIPAALAHLPVQGGLAVPVVAVRRGDRYAISVNHTRKQQNCLRHGLCGICGHPLTRPAVAITGPEGVDMHHATDPPMHPHCAAYSMKACPMLSGRMSHYLADRGDLLAGPCDLPGCDCGGFIRNPASPQHGVGKPAPERWYAVWLASYSLAVNPSGELIGIAWDEPLRVREVSR